MPNKEDCWDIISCPFAVRNICPVYKTNRGKECWKLADAKAVSPRPEQDRSCLDCPVYLKNHK